jgi:hypothetical protein
LVGQSCMNTCQPEVMGRVWLNLSVANSGTGFWGFQFIVAFRYPTPNLKLLNLVYRCPFVMYWSPL